MTALAFSLDPDSPDYVPSDWCRPCGMMTPRGTHPNQNGILIAELLGGDGPHVHLPWRDIDGADEGLREL